MIKKEKKKVTQTSRIKKYLKEGNSITPLDALRMYGTFRLASIICNLRNNDKFMADKEIKTTMVENKFGVKFASYRIKWKVFNSLEVEQILKNNNKRMLQLVK
tara:strand:- start:181 stop:489 length:309 start_codon:yes stop_codon:yes gene_type:complete